MRWLRLIIALLSAKFKTKINLNDTSALSFTVWLTDVDVSIMNHAALLTVMEIGRIDFMVRSNFFKTATKHKWYFPSQALSVQFYRPLKAFQRAELFTKILFVDAKWIYVEQKVMRKGKDIAVCLVKGIVKKGRETIPIPEIIKTLGFEDAPSEKYEFIDTHELMNEQMRTYFTDH